MAPLALQLLQFTILTGGSPHEASLVRSRPRRGVPVRRLRLPGAWWRLHRARVELPGERGGQDARSPPDLWALPRGGPDSMDRAEGGVPVRPQPVVRARPDLRLSGEVLLLPDAPLL